MQPAPGYGLAIHTSTPVLGLALDNFAGDRHHLLLDLGRSLGGELHEQLAAFLRPRRWCDLKFIAVAQGPGGFTGTRMGVVVARTLAQQLDVPLFGVSTLAAYALSQWDGGEVPPERAIALRMQAQRQELFVAVYGQSTPQASGPPELKPQLEPLPVAWVADQVIESAAWPALIAPGKFAQCSVQEPVQIAIAGPLAPSVVSLLTLAQRQYDRGDRPHWSGVLPFYGQHPVALEAQAHLHSG
ncbi:MAG: tRNA (adenosine(37)-N6)-threonylcarbamoyltransferase complex dimerization subunit type 1 TsaB [Synechococcales cyanobacterium CRU_2_2]|nr:tRNA (adenosine(37)-N6)-threonylcarbamoyltransferase complex dimerization subunit type 1 TsaB [Synechococcales cyanobacterium CRU_2_2]